MTKKKPKVDPLTELRRLHDAAAAAMRPNENSRGPWKAMPFADSEYSLLAPAYLRRPHRMVLGEISVDGLSTKEAQANSKAIAEFVVAAVNRAIEELHPSEFCPHCSHPMSWHTTGCTVLHCKCRRPAPAAPSPAEAGGPTTRKGPT